MSISEKLQSHSLDTPSLCLEAAERLSDPILLEELLTFTSSFSSNDWKLVHAYILWRLSRIPQLLFFLRSLPHSAHNNSQYWLLYGLALKNSSNSNDLVAAESSFLKAIKISPDRPDVYYNLANLLHVHNPESAISYYLTSLQISPFQAHVWHNLGLSFHSLARFSHALTCFKISLLIDPNNSSCFCNLGLSYLSLSSLSSSEKSFESATRLNPFDSKSQINLANIHLSRRDIDSAISLLSDIPSDSLESREALFNLSLCYLLTGKY